MPVETPVGIPEKSELTPASNTTILMSKPVGLEESLEFQTWLKDKLAEVLRYLKLSFNLELSADKLLFYPFHLGYPDPIGQLRTHARIWGYNYKIDGENAINPATGQLMSYVVWQILDPPVMPIEVTEPPLEFDEDNASESFDAEPTETASVI